MSERGLIYMLSECDQIYTVSRCDQIYTVSSDNSDVKDKTGSARQEIRNMKFVSTSLSAQTGSLSYADIFPNAMMSYHSWDEVVRRFF